MNSHMAYAWVNQETKLFLKTYYENKSSSSQQNDLSKNDKMIQIINKNILVDGKPLFLTIVRPADVKKTLPVFVYLHGGGWVFGNFKGYEALVRQLVLDSQAAAVFVNYTLSPKVHYPVAINQSYEALVWISKHGKELNLDEKRLAIVGDSAGGNLAAAVSLMAKNNSGPHILLQVLICPVLDANFNTTSYKQFAKGYFLTKQAMEYYWNAYVPNKEERKQIYASPLQATIAMLKGLPPTLIQTAENDVLRDEAESYAMKLDEAGVPVASVRYNGTVHDFPDINSLNVTSSSQLAIHQVADALKRALNKD